MIEGVSTVKARKIRQCLDVLTRTNNVSEQALRLRTIFRKLTNDFQVEWGAELYGGARTVVATDRRQGFTALAVFRTTLEGATPWCRPRPRLPNDRPSRYRPNIDFRG